MKQKIINPFPSLTDVIFIVVFLICIFNSYTILSDGDTGYHIRAGEYILAHREIPHQDIFSYHKPVFPWVAHEWLSEIIMALLHRAWNLNAVVLFFTLSISTVCSLVFLFLKRESNILIALAVSLLTIQTTMVHWLARPHIFTLLIVVFWYKILSDFQYKNKNRIYLLPIIMLLWVNLHGGFIIGFLLLGIYGLGNLLQFPKAENVSKFKVFFVTGVLCLMTSLINPRGYEILFFPFKFLSHKYLLDHNTELLSPNFHYFMPFTAYLFLVLAIICFCKLRLDFIETLIFIGFTYLALTSMRHIPLFAIVMAPIVNKRLHDSWRRAHFRLKEGIENFSGRIGAMDQAACIFIWSLVVFFCVVLFLHLKDLNLSFSPKHKPVDAVNFLLKENITGNMFCDDEFGDYIIYKAWPQYKVFMDGRNDMYGTRIIKQYHQIISLKRPWKALLKKYDTNWVIFPSKAPLSAALNASNDWKLIYSDKVASIFVRNVPQNYSLITKHPRIRLASVMQ